MSPFVSVIITDRDFGPMKKAEAEAEENRDDCESEYVRSDVSMKAMFYPIVVMLLSVPVVLYLSGNGNILEGSGSSAIFYAVLVTLGFIFAYYLLTGVMSLEEYFKELKEGAGNMVGIGAILLLAFSLGEVTVEMHTGPYLASLVEGILNPSFLAGVIFIVAALIAFSTGTSWGTFSIMIPIALPMAAVLGSDYSLVIAAVIGGIMDIAGITTT